MSFQAPLVLLALLVEPALVAALIAERRRRRRYVVRFTGVSTVRSVMAGTPAWRRHLPAALFLAALAALIVGLARPQHTVAVAIDKASVMLVMDVSGSMEATDVQPSRLDAARDAATAFVNKVPASSPSARGSTPSSRRPRTTTRCAACTTAWSPRAGRRPATR